MVTSEQSKPPDNVEEYEFNFYKKRISATLTVKKWRFYRDGKTWLVDDVYGVHKTIGTNVQGGKVYYRCKLLIERGVGKEGNLDIAYMSLE